MRTVKEFIELAKNSPNKLSFGSVGVGTPQHLGGELFKMHAGVDLVHVPFRGATAVMPDLLAGRIDMFIGAINSLLPLIREGSLRAHRRDQPQAHRLAAGRSDAVRGGLSRLRGRLRGRAGGAGRHAARHHRDAQPRDREAIIATPGFHQRMAAIGVDVVGTTPAAYAKFISDDYAKWGKVVAAAGIKPE